MGPGICVCAYVLSGRHWYTHIFRIRPKSFRLKRCILVLVLFATGVCRISVPAMASFRGSACGSAADNTPPLRVCKTIMPSAGPLDYFVGAVLHIAVWGGGMVLGPLLIIGAPLGFLVWPSHIAAALASTVALLLSRA